MEAVATAPQSVNQTVSKISTPSVEIKSDKVDSSSQKNADIELGKTNIDTKEVVSEFNKISNELNLDVEFDYNKKIGEFTISVTDKATGEIIRKLPTEDAIRIKESMKDLIGVLFDKKG